MTAAPSPERGARRGPRLPWVLLGVWCAFLVMVQPWARPGLGGTSTADQGSSAKGILLLACLGVLVVSVGVRARLRLSPFLSLYLAYGALFVVVPLLLDYGLDPAVRAARIVVAVVAWSLLWCFARDDPTRLLTAQLVGYAVLAGTVAVGALLRPGAAWHQTTGNGGERLMGALLPMLPPRVGEVGAMLTGLALVALLARRLRFPLATALVLVGVTLLVLSKTRTAALALVLALGLAILVAQGTRLGRRGMVLLVAGGAATFLAFPVISAWFTRAQSSEQLASLTGRTTVWEHIVRSDTTLSQLLWGRGLGTRRVVLRRGEGDINLMAIDNSWLSTYWETGLVGVAIVATAVLVLLVQSVRARDPYVRAGSVFLVVFVLVSSVSESGLSDVSAQMLALVVAATAVHADRHGHRRRGDLEKSPLPPGDLTRLPSVRPPRASLR